MTDKAGKQLNNLSKSLQEVARNHHLVRMGVERAGASAFRKFTGGSIKAALAARTLTAVMRRLGIRVAALLGPTGLLVAGIAVATLGLYAMVRAAVRAARRLAELARQMDLVAKQARFAGLRIGQAFSADLQANLSGTGNALSDLRRQYLQLARTAKSGDLESAVLLGQAGISGSDLSDRLSDTERFNRLLRRANSIPEGTLQQIFGPEGARRFREIARSTNNITDRLSGFRFDTTGAERLTSELTTTRALLDSIRLSIRNISDPLQQILASPLAAFNRELAKWAELMNRIAQATRQVYIATQLLKGNFDAATDFATQLQQLQNTVTTRFQAFTQPAGAAVTLESGGFSAVQAAVRQGSLLSLMRENVEANKRTADNTDGQPVDINTEENRQNGWDLLPGPTSRAAAITGVGAVVRALIPG